jgi:hypothetical protein
MFCLYLRFIVPLALLWWGIKKNPFYKSYPIMLPFMVVLFVISKFTEREREVDPLFISNEPK